MKEEHSLNINISIIKTEIIFQSTKDSDGHLFNDHQIRIGFRNNPEPHLLLPLLQPHPPDLHDNFDRFEPKSTEKWTVKPDLYY